MTPKQASEDQYAPTDDQKRRSAFHDDVRKNSEELREKIDKAIYEAMCSGVSAMDSGWTEVYKPQLQEMLVSLIHSYANEARIDELKRIEVNDVGPVYAWTTGEDPDEAMLISERVAELEKLL